MQYSQIKAAVVGTRWGMVHVNALRALGVQVLAIVGLDDEHTQALAQREGIAHAFCDVRELLKLQLDWVSLATPPSTHAQLARQLGQDIALMVEKPLLGLMGKTHDVQWFGPRAWVNYAMPFVSAAHAFEKMLRQVHVRHIVVHTQHDLGATLDLRMLPERLLDMASHPLSWCTHVYGAPHHAQLTADSMVLRLGSEDHTDDTAGIACTVRCTHAVGLNGLSHRIMLNTSEGMFELIGQFTQGKPWQFAVYRNHQLLSQDELLPAPNLHGQRSVPETDPWMSANIRSIGAALQAAFNPATAPSAVHDSISTIPPCTVDKAFQIDRCVWQAVWQPLSGEERDNLQDVTMV